MTQKNSTETQVAERKYRLGAIQREPLVWCQIMFSSPLRSHVVCASISAALCALIIWLWLDPATLVADRSHSQTQIEDAINLIDNGDQLRERFRSADTNRQSIQSRIDEIVDWLPKKRTFDSIRADLQKLTSETDVQMIAIDRGNINIGTRVAVLNTRVEVQGTYGHLCRFLKKLAELESPIWCDEVRVVRGNRFGEEKDHTQSENQVLCLATLSLRAPFAGDETTGGKLLLRRNIDAI